MRRRQSKTAIELMCNCTHTRSRGKEKKLETMAIIFRALDRGLKYIQDSLYLHIRYSMIRVKHVEDERQRIKGKVKHVRR